MTWLLGLGKGLGEHVNMRCNSYALSYVAAWSNDVEKCQAYDIALVLGSYICRSCLDMCLCALLWWVDFDKSNQSHLISSDPLPLSFQDAHSGESSTSLSPLIGWDQAGETGLDDENVRCLHPGNLDEIRPLWLKARRAGETWSQAQGKENQKIKWNEIPMAPCWPRAEGMWDWRRLHWNVNISNPASL